MQRLERVDCGKLIWKETGWGSRDFELWSGEDLVAVLYWPKWLSDRAVAECAAGKWYFDRVGFFRQLYVVTDANSGAEVACFEPDWLGDGDLVLATGRVFHWCQTKMLCNSWALADEEENAVLEIHESMRWFKHEAEVVPHVQAGSWPELMLLILVSWYLAYNRLTDTAAAVAVCASVACIG